MLEAKLYTSNAFATLTYSDEKLPKTSDGLPTLNPKHTQDWLKRFRKAIEPSRIRYFLVGEYGDETQRPHYHVALFNYPTCEWGGSRYRLNRNRCCIACDTVRDTWGHGQIMLGTLTDNSANYVAGYVTKKLTSKTDPRLKGRHQEFTRQSNRPGIGADFMEHVASEVLRFNLVEREGDVPSSLRHGTRLLPLGRYLRRRLRKLVGEDEKAPQATLEKHAEKMQPLQQAAFDASESYSKFVVKFFSNRRGSTVTRQHIYRKRGPL